MRPLFRSPEGAELPEHRAGNPFLLAADGGSGAWETAVLRFAAAVYGHDGAALVAGVLPMVLQLAGPATNEGAAGGRTRGVPYLQGIVAKARNFGLFFKAVQGCKELLFELAQGFWEYF